MREQEGEREKEELEANPSAAGGGRYKTERDPGPDCD